MVFETAYGDGTVPNPTAGTLYRAGQLFDRVVYYRNDKTPTYASDPHGWLADPTLSGRTSGEQLLGLFLATGQLFNTNPAWLESPIADPNNLECLHYPDPQTGQQQRASRSRRAATARRRRRTARRPVRRCRRPRPAGRRRSWWPGCSSRWHAGGCGPAPPPRRSLTVDRVRAVTRHRPPPC